MKKLILRFHPECLAFAQEYGHKMINYYSEIEFDLDDRCPDRATVGDCLYLINEHGESFGTIF